MDAFVGHCRLCLCSDEVDVHLFEVKKGYWQDISEMFRIRLKHIRGWPTTACRSCIRIVEEMRGLKEKIEESQEKLVEVQKSVEFLAWTTGNTSRLRRRSASVIKKSQSTDTLDIKPSGRETRRSSRRESCPKTDEASNDGEVQLDVRDEDERPRREAKRSVKKEPSAKDKEELINQEQRQQDGGEEESQDNGEDPDSEYEESPKRKRGSLQSDKNSSLEVSLDTSGKRRRNRGIKDHPYDDMMFRMNLLHCHLCSESFRKYGNLVRHCTLEHAARPNITCCQRSFPKTQLADHMKYHKDNTAFNCKPCNKNHLSGYLLERHNATKHQMGASQHQCPVCDHKFRAPNLLKIHMTKHTDVSERSQFKCDLCEKVFHYETSLKSHIQRTHDKKLHDICETCGKGFASKWLLNSHMKRHELKLSEQCDICLKYFLNMKSHKLKVHTTKEMVECNECGKKVSPTYLKTHIRSYHGERKEIPCEICGKIFKNTKNYKVHMGLHYGVKYNCRFCPMEFNILGNRTKHEKGKHFKGYKLLKSAEEAEKQKPPTQTIEFIFEDEVVEEEDHDGEEQDEVIMEDVE